MKQPAKILRAPSVWLRIAVAAALSLLTLYAVLVLPFAFPPSIPSVSTAYAAGFNNRVAQIAAGVLSVLAGVAALWLGCGRPLAEPEPLLKPWLLWVGGAMMAVQLALGVAMVWANGFYGEAAYFLIQIDKGMKLHLGLYRELQFAYGPLLYWWPVAWIRLLAGAGVGMMAAYVVALVLMQMAGVALLFYTIRALPLRRSLQGLALVVVAIGAVSPTMGENYSLFRFVVAMAGAVWLARQQRLGRAVVVAAICSFAGFAVSAEVGVASVGSALGCALLRGWQGRERWRWLLLVPAALAGAALLIAITGADYFVMLRNAGSGGYDLLLTPEPRTLLVLVSMIGLAPLAVARAVRGRDPLAPMLGALYGCSLGLMPVALGRADSGHQFFFSLGAMLLSLVAVDGAGRRLPVWPARAWAACLLVWAVMAQAANAHLYRESLAELARQAISPHPYTFPVAELEQELHGERVFAPFALPWPAFDRLLSDGRLRPDFYCELSSIWRAPAEERRIAQMRAGEYVLAPDEPLANPIDFDSGAVARWRRLGLVYREKHEPYVPGLRMDQELAANWAKVRNIDGYALYRKLR